MHQHIAGISADVDWFFTDLMLDNGGRKVWRGSWVDAVPGTCLHITAQIGHQMGINKADREEVKSQTVPTKVIISTD